MSSQSAVDERLLTAVRDRLSAGTVALTPHAVAEALRAEGRPVGDATVLAVHDALTKDVVGAGPLEGLLRLPGVTDVLVNGAESVYLDRGSGLELAEVEFPDEDSVRRLAQRLAALGGRRLDDAAPWVDVRLPDGTRFHAVLAPLARPGTTLSLRVPARRAFSLEELVELGTMPTPIARALRELVAAKVAFLISGGTGSGKTTLLASLLSLVAPEDRIVLVEDAGELRPDHPHVVALEARPANIEGQGAVTLRDLVRQALRMRPDRIVVGEVRGAEVTDLLAALNTGHDGGCGTIHANSAADVPTRVDNLALAAGLSREAAHAQFSSAIGAVVHMERSPHGRRVTEIAVPEQRAGLVHMSTALAVNRAGEVSTGAGAEAFIDRLDQAT